MFVPTFFRRAGTAIITIQIRACMSNIGLRCVLNPSMEMGQKTIRVGRETNVAKGLAGLRTFLSVVPYR